MYAGGYPTVLVVTAYLYTVWENVKMRLEEKLNELKSIGDIWRKNVQQPSARDVQVGGAHYLSMGVEPWDVVDTWPREQRIGFYRGNALKYVMRMGAKDMSLQEIQKASHYLQKLIEVLSEPS
jgi:hypothetical protein